MTKDEKGTQFAFYEKVPAMMYIMDLKVTDTCEQVKVDVDTDLEYDQKVLNGKIAAIESNLAPIEVITGDIVNGDKLTNLKVKGPGDPFMIEFMQSMEEIKVKTAQKVKDFWRMVCLICGAVLLVVILLLLSIYCCYRKQK